MEYDELELDTLGEEKQRCSLLFLIQMLRLTLWCLSCIPSSLICFATRQTMFYNGRLPVHVRMLLDEFANIGQIPQFEKLIATIRSREISASIILQSKSQLKAIYRDNADTIEGNCDTTLFLGGKERPP